jgi:hypothetical protein
MSHRSSRKVDKEEEGPVNVIPWYKKWHAIEISRWAGPPPLIQEGVINPGPRLCLICVELEGNLCDYSWSLGCDPLWENRQQSNGCLLTY